MKITKKITSIVLALLLAVSAFAGLAITANAVDGAAAPDATADTIEATTPITLYIHKYEINNDSQYAMSSAVGNVAGLSGTTSDAPTGKTPLAGVEFTIWKVGDMSTAVPSNADKPATAAAANEAYGVATAAPITNASGVATFSITGAEKGLYFVMETDAPDKVASAGRATSFYVYLPMAVNKTGASGTTWLTGVSVYPKNVVTLGSAVLEKKFNGKTVAEIVTDNGYDAANTTFPTFTLYKGEDANGIQIADDIQIAAGYQTYTANTIADFNEDDDVVIAQRNGKIAVGGLPVGTYCFVEKTGAKVNGVVYGKNTTPQKFVVTESNLYSTVETSDSDTFGTQDPEIDSAATTSNGNSFYFSFDNKTTPIIEKTVDKTEQEIGKNVVWTLNPTVPTDIAGYNDYYVTDAIQPGLTYKGTVVESTTAYSSDAYTVTFDANTVKVQFNKVNDSYAYLENNAPTIKITTEVNKDAVVDTPIKNQATVSYNNGYETGSSDSPAKEVVTRGVTVLKVDANDSTKTLDGATFELYRDVNGTNKIAVVQEETGVYRLKDTDENTATTTDLTTANGGKILIKGLAPDVDYYVKETNAPTGYQLNTNILKLTLTSGHTIDQNSVTITNAQTPNLPLTGGMGTILFTVAGLALIGGSAFFFIRSRKSRKEEI